MIAAPGEDSVGSASGSDGESSLTDSSDFSAEAAVAMMAEF